MSRPPRAAEGGLVYHAQNRAAARATIFADDGDYAAFLRVLAEAVARQKMRLLAYCLLPDHFHVVVWPRKDGDLPDFMRWLTMTHTQRWHAQRRSAGSGHLYAGRYRSFPVQKDGHLVTICRHVERNALRAGLVPRAQEWPWGSLHRPDRGSEVIRPELSAWPIPKPRGWTQRVNASLKPAEEEAVGRSILRGQPLGDPAWQARTADRLGIGSTLRPRGRPRTRP
jgi:putative transposase